MGSDGELKLQGKPGAAGLQRVLEDKSGDTGNRPWLCDAGAAYCSWRERSPVCFVPKLAGKPGVCSMILVAIRPSDLNASDNVGLSVCGSLIGDAPLGQRGPELCGRLASSQVHASTPDC